MTAGVLCLVFAAFLLWRIHHDGLLTGTDELLTAERAREMHLSGSPWTVSFNFKHSFNKPPLQYWLIASTLPLWRDRETAVRGWSVLQALLALIATGWLAHVLDRRRPWLIPLSMAILVTCQSFMHEAGVAKLDVGLVGFVTLTIGAVLCARRQPSGAGWLGVAALACWLGSLQKNPFGLLCWLLLLAARWIAPPAGPDGFSWRREVKVLALAALAVTLWPLLQIAGHGMRPTQAFGFSEVAGLTGPERLGAQPYFYLFIRLLTRWMWGPLALLTSAWALFRRFLVAKDRTSGVSRRAAELAFLSLTIITLATLGGFRSVRYLLPLFPCLCALAALAAHRVLERPALWTRVSSVALMAVFFGLDLHRVRANIDPPPDVSPQYAAALALGGVMRRADPGTRCVLVRHEEQFNTMLYGSFYLFYGDLAVPIQERTLAQLPPAELTPPSAGVCERRDFEALQRLSPGMVIRAEHGGFVCWEAIGAE